MTITSTDTLKLETDAPIATITIAREGDLNALSTQVVADLAHLCGSLEIGKDVRAVIVTGAGDRLFSAGVDVLEMARMTPGEALAFGKMSGALAAAIERSRMSWIAAVNGIAFGGGWELALACDFIYASGHARFGHPKVTLGGIAGFGGHQRLSRRIGAARAKQLCVTGDIISATDALSIGLCDAVVPHEELRAKARDLAERIVRNGPLAISARRGSSGRVGRPFH